MLARSSRHGCLYCCNDILQKYAAKTGQTTAADTGSSVKELRWVLALWVFSLLTAVPDLELL